MFNRLRNKIETLTSHNTDKRVSLEDLLYLYLYSYEGAEEISGDPNFEIRDKDEFAISLYGFLGVVKEFLSTERTADIINELEDNTKERAVEIAAGIEKIQPKLASVNAKLREAKELDASLKESKKLLQDQNDELDRFQKEEAALQKEITRLDKPELGELDILQKNTDDLRGQYDELKKRALRLTEEFNKLKFACDERNDECQSAERKNENLAQNIKQINEKIERLQLEQREKENELKRFEEIVDALRTAEWRKKYNELVEEAKLLIAWWESLKRGELYEQVFDEIEAGKIEERLRELNEELKREVAEFQEDLDGRRKKYGEFLAQWESKIQNKKETLK